MIVADEARGPWLRLQLMEVFSQGSVPSLPEGRPPCRPLAVWLAWATQFPAAPSVMSGALSWGGGSCPPANVRARCGCRMMLEPPPWRESPEKWGSQQAGVRLNVHYLYIWKIMKRCEKGGNCTNLKN